MTKEYMKIYLVGGAVRDLIQGIQPKDKDFVVIGSSVEEMLSLGYEQVGKEFPVFLHPITKEEYALARKEKKTGLGYHGFKFEINNVSLFDDLIRRDLTINSMAMDLDTKEIVDYFNGQEDLKNKVLRHTSTAFTEDPLRILRIARFACQGFTIYQETLNLIKTIPKEDILNISSERIEKELRKALENEFPNHFFNSLNKMQVLTIFFPDINKNIIPNIKNHKKYTLAEQKTILFYNENIDSLFNRKILRNEEYDLSLFLKENMKTIKKIKSQSPEVIYKLYFNTKLKDNLFFNKIERILQYFEINTNPLAQLKKQIQKAKITQEESLNLPKEEIIKLINKRRMNYIKEFLNN